LKTSANFFAHPTSVIDEGCAIGNGVKIWHFSHLMKGCKVGDHCTIGQNVFVASNVVLGKNVKVQNNVSIYEGVICEDDVFLGPSMVFTNIINPRSAISRRSEYKQTIVRKGASIGANATIICGNEIGAYAFIGAGAVVTKPVPAYALIAGNPGRQKGWMSEQGYPLKFDSEGKAVCKGNGELYVLQQEKVSKVQEYKQQS
jgi:UDP-2-acetamido-3-amino-2,3-dideoxy-glucuronate N-acetyltransferase